MSHFLKMFLEIYRKLAKSEGSVTRASACVRVRACVRACVRAYVRACARAHLLKAKPHSGW